MCEEEETPRTLRLNRALEPGGSRWPSLPRMRRCPVSHGLWRSHPRSGPRSLLHSGDAGDKALDCPRVRIAAPQIHFLEQLPTRSPWVPGPREWGREGWKVPVEEQNDPESRLSLRDP